MVGEDYDPIESVRRRPGLAGLSDQHALLVRSAHRWLELHEMAGWKYRPPNTEMARDEFHARVEINGEIRRISGVLRELAAASQKPLDGKRSTPAARRLLATLVRLSDDPYRDEGRQAFQPFIDTLQALEVELALLPSKRNTKQRKMTREQAHDLLRDWEEAKRTEPGGGKAIAEKWKQRMVNLGVPPEKAAKQPYVALRNLLRHARMVVGKD
jgi:hypothetical protein